MCATCGCSGTEAQHHQHHDHSHDRDHGHHHHHDRHHDHHDEPALLKLERDVLAKNDRVAEMNRGWLAGRGLTALNLVSSPGAGKTTLLERTIRDFGSTLSIQVIEGDQATERDAARIRQAGARAYQVNTGTGCHLDATMVQRALEALDPRQGLVVIENVGNLVCPALFDLGEQSKVLICSVTEGSDKPLKYPHMFRAAEHVVINKVDLLPYVTFDVEQFKGNALAANHGLSFFEVSATRGDGLDSWYRWLRSTTPPAAKTP